MKIFLAAAMALSCGVASTGSALASDAFLSSELSSVKPGWQGQAQQQNVELDTSQQQSFGLRIGKVSEQRRYYLGLQLISADKIQMTSFTGNHDWLWNAGSVSFFSGLTAGIDIASFEPELKVGFLNDRYQIQADTTLGFGYGGQAGVLWQPSSHLQLELGFQLRKSTLSADIEVQLGNGLPGSADLEDLQRAYIGLNYRID